MLSSGTLGFCKPFFRNRRCPLWKRLTLLSKLMYNISKRLFNYLQITGFFYISSQLSLTSPFSDEWIIKSSISLLTLSRRRPLSHRNQSLICEANRWTGFYKITASVMKGLSIWSMIPNFSSSLIPVFSGYIFFTYVLD